MKNRRQKTVWTASVVTTFSLAACGGPGDAEVPSTTATSDTEPTATSTATEVPTATATPTTSASSVVSPVTASTSAAASASASAPAGPSFVRGKIAKDKGGKCAFTEETKAPDCPPNAKCNPPSPFVTTVACPTSGKLPIDIMVSKGETAGKCFYYEPREPTKCPPGVSCNPPPQKRVDVACPPTLAQ